MPELYECGICGNVVDSDEATTTADGTIVCDDCDVPMRRLLRENCRGPVKGVQNLRGKNV